jgi:hypothetical protein
MNMLLGTIVPIAPKGSFKATPEAGTFSRQSPMEDVKQKTDPAPVFSKLPCGTASPSIPAYLVLAVH